MKEACQNIVNGKGNAEGRKESFRTGDRFVISCPNCRHLNLDGNRFCHHCGKPLRSRGSESQKAFKEKTSRGRSRLPSHTNGLLIWLWLVLLIVSVFLLHVIISKSKAASPQAEEGSHLMMNPVLWIQGFQFSPNNDAQQIIGEALALAVGEKLFSSREIQVPAEFENSIFRTGDLILMDQPLRTYILSGRIIQEAKNFQVTARLRDSEGRIHLDFTLTVADDALFNEAADSISRRVGENLTSRSLGGPEDLMQNITTEDPQVWLDYTLGKKYFYLGRWGESRWYFKESVQRDPGFALGYQALSENAVVCGCPEQAWIWGQRALGWSDRISPRRRLLLEAETFLKSEKFIQEAGDVYMDFIRTYPWDARARYFKSILEPKKDNNFLWKEQVPFSWMAMAFSTFPLSKLPGDLCAQLPEKNDDRSPGIYFLYSLCCVIKGQNKDAMEYAKAGRTIHSAGIFDRLCGDIYWLQGDLDAAQLHYAANLKNLDPPEQIWRGFRLGQLALTRGCFKEARKVWTERLQTAEKQGLRTWAYRIHCALARMEISRQRYRSALSFSQQAMNIAAREDVRVYPYEGLFWQGLAQAGLKQWSDVDKTLSELETFCRNGSDPHHMRYYYYLKGVICAAGNILDLALEDFKQAAALIPEQSKLFDFSNNQAFFLNGLGEALEQTGRNHDAIEVYKRLGALTTGRMECGDIWALSLYQQGRIFDKLGQEEEAGMKYREFLSYWSDADRETWEKEEASRRLNEMTDLNDGRT
jgi:tetratricopeptide (TPR) repeat protein